MCSIYHGKSKAQAILTQLGLVVFSFLSFTPAWRSNYMAWLDPFPIVLGLWPAVIYYLASGAMLVYLYFINDDESTKLMPLCWMAVIS